jgi:Domain of unknown function (DUF4321)
MASGPHRPRFFFGVLVIGFIVGGFLTAFFRRWLPESAARDFLTTSANPVFGPISMDLLVINFTLGPLGLQVSLLSLIGVLVAYLVARSLF